MQAGIEFCNEWSVATGAEAQPRGKLVYVEGRERAVGNAMVASEPGGLRSTLNEIDLSPHEPTIVDPARLRLGILLAQ